MLASIHLMQLHSSSSVFTFSFSRHQLFPSICCRLFPLPLQSKEQLWNSSSATTKSDMHHIIVILKDSRERLPPNRSLASVEQHLYSCTQAAPRPLAALCWLKVTLCWAHSVFLSPCEISYPEVDLICIKWAHLSKQPGLRERLITAGRGAREVLTLNQFLQQGVLFKELAFHSPLGMYTLMSAVIIWW